MLSVLTFDTGNTLMPDYMLIPDSRGVTGSISDRLMSMILANNQGSEADQFDTKLNDANRQVRPPVHGAILTAYIGWKDFALACEEKSTADEVEYRGVLGVVTIRARSADFRGALSSRQEDS